MAYVRGDEAQVRTATSGLLRTFLLVNSHVRSVGFRNCEYFSDKIFTVLWQA